MIKIFAEWTYEGVRHCVQVSNSANEVFLHVFGPHYAGAILTPAQAREIADGLRAAADEAEGKTHEPD